ncbi:MAG: hypothetical protein BWX47_01739 [candidate division Hyd24-12 bacterium ADurb.Bin004]|nr:MAG: hypothetical protein BWX47_01739 [candidate division Hyd24-12 bacterium ADurb.Bin004]
MVQRIVRNHGCDGVVEIEVSGPCDLRNAPGKGFACERAGRCDGRPVVGQVAHLLPVKSDTGFRCDTGGDRAAEEFAVDGKGIAGRDARLHRGGHDDRTQGGHLLLEEADGVGRIGRPERVGADQLGEIARHMRRGGRGRPHFIQVAGYSSPGQRHRRLAPRKARTDDDRVQITREACFYDVAPLENRMPARPSVSGKGEAI